MSATAHNPEAVALAPTPVYVPGGRIPDDFNLSMENGLYVFSPTATVFKEFATFLGVVEEIAGREQGVVKVIVPKEWYVKQIHISYFQFFTLLIAAYF